jgi:hypothetical protein
MKTNIEEIADKLRIAWNGATSQRGVRWECLNERSRRGYIAVANKAVELCAPRILNIDSGVEECASEKQYRMLAVGEILEASDEVNTGSAGWVTLGPDRAGNAVNPVSPYAVGYYRRLVSSALGEDNNETREDAAKVIEHGQKSKAIDWKDGETHRVVGENIVFKGASFYADAAVVADKNATTIDWKGHYDRLKIQADAKVTELEKELKSAAEYVEKLERDVALLSNGTNEKLPTTDTIFFQFDDTVEELGWLQDCFPNNRVVALPEGVTLHAVTQIHG